MPGGFTGSRQGRNGALDLGSALLPSLIIGAELHNPARPSSASSASHKISSELGGRGEGLKDNIQNKRMKFFCYFILAIFCCIHAALREPAPDGSGIMKEERWKQMVPCYLPRGELAEQHLKE